MGQGLLGGHAAQLVAGASTEGPAGRGEHQATDLPGTSPTQALRKGGMLGVDGDELAGPGRLRDERPADHQRFLVGQGQGRAGFQRGERGMQSGRPRDRIEHHVGLHRREFLVGRFAGDQLRATRSPGCLEGMPELLLVARLGDSHDRHLELDGLLGQQRHVGTTRRQSGDPETVAAGVDHLTGLRSDRSGTAKKHNITHTPIMAHRPSGGAQTRCGRCGGPAATAPRMLSAP